MKLEEINSVEDFDGDICFTSSMDSTFLVAIEDSALQDWVLDLGASFYVTPHREWFVTFDVARVKDMFDLATVTHATFLELVMYK